MLLRGNLFICAVKALTESMNVETMTILAQKLIPDYSLHERTGYPERIPIPNKEAARQIVTDIRDNNIFPQFVNLLIEIHYYGLMGRRYPVAYLRDLVNGLHDFGFIYDTENRMFVEDSRMRKSRNWGVLREGEEYVFTFLRLDIVGSSVLVRTNKNEVLQSTYAHLRDIVLKAIDARNGRIWIWEGDSGLVAFHFLNKNLLATLSAMEIMHELFIYNQTRCKLDKPLLVRIAIHMGPLEYTNNEEEMKKSETIKKTVDIEANYTKPNTVTVSNLVYPLLDPIILGNQLQPIRVDDKTTYYSYELRWES
jgi:class 3 adenylate cyclase/ribosomal protein S19